MKKTLLTLLMLASVLFFACKNETTNDDENTSEKDTEVVEDTENNESEVTTEDFETFYEKFVTDDNFQIERVKFPVEGENIIDYGESEQWSKDNWYYLDDVDDVDSELTVEIDETETRVHHKIYLPNSGFIVEYAFELIEGKWFLTERTDASL